MAQRAFVRYTKKGHIVPGSLIVTTKGGYPKDGTYKEVIVDQCCGNQALRYNLITGENSNVGIGPWGAANPFPWSSGWVYLSFGCLAMSYDAEWADIYVPGNPATLQELVHILNERASFIGTFEIAEDGVSLILNISPEAASNACRGPITDTIAFFVNSSGL